MPSERAAPSRPLLHEPRATLFIRGMLKIVLVQDDGLGRFRREREEEGIRSRFSPPASLRFPWNGTATAASAW